VQAAAEVVVLADHTKIGADTMFQTVPTDVITHLVTDEPPPGEERAATELQALADRGVQLAVASAGPPAAPDTASGPAAAGSRDALPAPRRPHPLRPPTVPRLADLRPH
jgi:hypothetical protein